MQENKQEPSPQTLKALNEALTDFTQFINKLTMQQDERKISPEILERLQEALKFYSKEITNLRSLLEKHDEIIGGFNFLHTINNTQIDKGEIVLHFDGVYVTLPQSHNRYFANTLLQVYENEFQDSLNKLVFTFNENFKQSYKDVLFWISEYKNG